MDERPKLEVATAIVRRGSEILLVLQGRTGEKLFWALPGGIVEQGELAPDGLAREVREETGIVVEKLGRLAYVTQVDDARPPGWLGTVFTFEVDSWSGDLDVDDPDGVVFDAAFVALDDAVERLAETEWLSLAARYLRGEISPGSYHVKRRLADGRIEIAAAAPAQPEASGSRQRRPG
ncbi:MAG TPA: NUDIX domain-containing protein [Gaiellaceae bacterium]|nr:NUDIX domain-containing protein [Gaiellaceae bacterium]